MNKPAWSEETPLGPYSLDVEELMSEGARFRWAIRRNGKLLQRGDRIFPSEQEARRKGIQEIERLLSTHGS